MASIGYKITADNKELLKTFKLTEDEINALSMNMASLGKTIDRILIDSADSLKEFNNQISNNKILIQDNIKEYERMLPDLEKVKDPNATDGGQEYIALKNAINETVGALIGYEEENKKLQTEYDKLSASQKELISLNEKLKTPSVPQLEGVESAITGMSGALSAAQGVMSLLGRNSDHFTEIQAKLQSAMNVTAGLQEVNNTLHHISAFRINTVAKVTELLAIANNKLATTFGISTTAAKVLMGTLTIGLSVAVTAIMAILNRYISIQQKATEEQKKFADTVSGNSANSISEFERLRKSYDKLGDSIKDKTNFIVENQDAFRGLGVEVNNVADAENLFVDNAENFKLAIMARAKAVAAMELASEKYKQAIEKMITAESMPDTVGTYVGGGTAGASPIFFEKENEKKKKLYKEIEKLNEEGDVFFDHLLIFSHEERERLKDANLSQLHNIEEDTKAWWEEYKKMQENALAGFTQDQIGSSEWNKIKAERDKAIKILGKWDFKEENHREKETQKEDDLPKQINKEFLQLQIDNIQSEIDLMEEGHAKRMAQIDHNYDEEIRKLEEKVQKWRDAQNGMLTVEQTAAYDTSYENITQDRLRKEQKEFDDAAAKERQSWIEYNTAYGDYQAKRLAITEEYALKIAEAEEGGKKAALAEERDKTLQELDSSMLKQSDLWENLFKDASQQTNTFIRKIIDDTQSLIDFMDGKEGTILPKGIDADWVKSLNKKDLETLLDGLIKKRDALEKRNPFGQIINGFKLLAKTSGEAGDKMDEATKSKTKKQAFDQIAQGAQGASTIIGALGNTVKSFFGEGAQGDIENITKAIQGLMGVGAGAAKVFGGDLSGIVDILQGVPSIIDGIAGLFGGNDDAKLLKQIEKYTELISLYDKLIDKQKEYLSTLTGEDAIKQAEDTAQLIERRQEAERKKLEAWFYTGSSRNHHSMWYRINRDQKKELTNAGIKDVREVLNYDDKQWETLQKNIELWEKLPEEVRAYGESVIKGKEDIEALGKTLRESLTGSSFSELQSSLLDLVSTADMAFGDIEKSFGDHMKKAIQQGIKTKYLTEGLKEWEKAFAAAMDDGVLTNDEANKLRESYTRIAQQANEDYINRMKAAGLEGMLEGESKGEEEIKASSRTLQGVTQDTASELLGQARALRMDIAEGLEYVKTRDNNLGGMTTALANLQTDTLNIQGLVQSQLTSLVQIERNTFHTVNRLDQIIDNGVKIKEGKE